MILVHDLDVIRPTARIRSAASFVWPLVIGAAVTFAAAAHVPRAAHAQTTGFVKGQRGWLGVSMAESTPGQVHVREVLAASPAEAAGVRAKDRILRVEHETTTSARDVVRAVSSHAAGKSITVVLERDGKELALQIRLVPIPSGEQMLRMQHVGRAAPQLQGLRTSIGTRGPTLADYRGKVVVLDFWASWCTACRVTSDHLNRWHARFGSQGLTVLGVAGEPAEDMARGARRFQIHYPTFADPRMETSTAYHVRELPSLVLVDRNGIVRDVTTGFDPVRLREMEALLARLLAEPPPRVPSAGQP